MCGVCVWGRYISLPLPSWIRGSAPHFPPTPPRMWGNGTHPSPLPSPQDVGSLLAGMAMQGGQPFFSVWSFLLNGGMDKVLSRYPGGGGAAYSLGRALRGMLGLVLDEPMVGECAHPAGAGQGGGDARLVMRDVAERKE